MSITSFIKSTLVTSALLASSLTFAANIEVSTNENDLAIQGYDSVSYFTKGAPIKGSDQYTAAYNGAIYHFASAENRDQFKADPTKYAPQYGGFCAMGVAMNQKFETDPTAWHIRDNKLYLNLNKDVQKAWLRDVPGHLETAQENWVDIKGLTLSQIKKINE